MGTENPFKKIKLKKRLGFETRGMRWLYRAFYPFFHCRVTFPESFQDLEEPVVFVANHYNVFGPLGFMVSVPLNIGIWMNEEMVDPESARITLQPGMKKMLPFLSDRRIERICAKIAAFIAGVLTRLSSIPVSRSQPSKLLSTMRKSISALEEGHHLLIFPETGLPDYSLTSVTPFFSGFAMLGQLYHRKTGKSLRFCPCYIDEQHRVIRVGELVTYEPDANPSEETERVSGELNRRIREMAAQNRGVEKEEKKPGRQLVLLLCNTLRLLLLIPLIVMLSLGNARMILLFYCISQGIRILFNVAGGTYASTNRFSFLLSHGIGMLTDFGLMIYLGTRVPMLIWLVAALVLNGTAILISSLLAMRRYHRCAGLNYFDTLSANLLCAVGLQQLLQIPLNEPVLRVLTLAILICLGLSAFSSAVFNARIGKETP